MARVVDHFLPAVRSCPLGARQSWRARAIAVEAGGSWARDSAALSRTRKGEQRLGRHAADLAHQKAMWVYRRPGPHGYERGSRQPRRARRARLSVVSRVRDLARVAFAAGETMSGWRQNWQAEGLGFGDHALVVGDQRAELTRDAAAVARWIASSDRSVVAPICAAAGAIGSIASNRKPASTPTATAGAVRPRRRAVRVTSTVASRLEARSGQRRSSWRMRPFLLRSRSA